MGTLKDKVVVVTGASRGLGESMAIGFAEQGANLTLAARTEPDLEKVAAACREAGAGDVRVAQTDISSEADVQKLVDDTISARGRIDVFVANAGTSYANFTDKHYRELVTYDLEIIEQLFKVNVFGTWLCMKAALPIMEEGGSFIAIGSETGRVLYPGAGAYAVTKSTIDAMVTLTARESATKGVRVNCLSPGGMVDTQLFGPNGMPEWLKQQHPPLPADVIVPAALWLASEDSAGITGAFISGKEFNASSPQQMRASLESSAQKH
ncbi:MAG: SDR family NAD(P)-dependent oxidoreductase [Actinomycetota bacterium]|nr:SDR family oxidoreductase [Actinomycetota bacterium]